MAKTTTSYEQLERRALLNLASRTLATAASPPEHVEAASRRLTGETPDARVFAQRAKQRLSKDEISTLRRLLRRIVATASPSGPSPSDDA